MKVYGDCFGTFSINLKNAIALLKEFKETGNYDVYKYGGKYINARPDEYGMFRQGRKLKYISFNLINLADTYGSCGEELFKEEVQFKIEELEQYLTKE